MKRKLFIGISFLLFSISLCSQDIIILDAPIAIKDDTTIIVAPKMIRLESGFRITPSEGERVKFQIGKKVPTQKSTFQLNESLRSVEKIEPNVMIYPTSVGQILNVDSKTDEKIESVEIFTITGFRALSVKNLDVRNSLDVGRLAQGIHIVVVESGGERFTFKIIKK